MGEGEGEGDGEGDGDGDGDGLGDGDGDADGLDEGDGDGVGLGPKLVVAVPLSRTTPARPVSIELLPSQPRPEAMNAQS